MLRLTYESETLESLSGIDLSESIENAGVEAGVGLYAKRRLEAWLSTYLHSALDNIERAHHGVSDTAGEDTSDHALLVVTDIVNV